MHNFTLLLACRTKRYEWTRAPTTYSKRKQFWEIDRECTKKEDEKLNGFHYGLILDDLLVENFFLYDWLFLIIRKYSVFWINNDRIDARVYKITVTWRKERMHILQLCQRTIKFKVSCIFHNHLFSFFSFLFAQLASISGRKFISSPLYIVLLRYLLLSGIFLFFKISWNIGSIGFLTFK